MLENRTAGYKTKDWHRIIMDERNIDRAEADKFLRKNIPPEVYFQTKIMNRIKEEFPKSYVVKITQGAYSTGGIPDILCVIEGRYFGFEVKRPVFGKPTRLQTRAINQINEKAGGSAAVVTYPEEAINFIRTRLGIKQEGVTYRQGEGMNIEEVANANN